MNTAVVLVKSALHNIRVAIVGFGFAHLGAMVDSRLGIARSPSPPRRSGTAPAGSGFLLRFWATFQFYAHQIRVISLEPQDTLVTSGPSRFSRIPLYPGGNVFIFLGATLMLGSPTALIATLLHLPLGDQFIRREEQQLKRRFGDEWRRYKAHVRRWL